MNKYVKILFVTLGIQVGLLLMAYIFYNLPIGYDILKKVGLLIFVVNTPISLIIGIVLAIKCGTTVKEKLMYIFLMPTNYTWIIYIFLLFWFAGKIMNILTNIPENFG